MQAKLVQRLDALSKAFAARRIYDIKRISKDCINDASLTNDYEMAKIAVISYSLFKMLTKEHFFENRQWPSVSKNITDSLEKSRLAAERDQHRAFKKQMKNTIHKIEEIDLELSHFARTLYEKSKIKQASSAYALGLSLSQAADLTGANKKELQHYIGATRIHDEEPITTGILQRIRGFKQVMGL